MHIQNDERGRGNNKHGHGFVELAETQWEQVFQILVGVGFLRPHDQEQFNKVVLDKNAGLHAPCEVRLDGAKFWSYSGKVYVEHNNPSGRVSETLQSKIDGANQALKQLLGDRGGI